MKRTADTQLTRDNADNDDDVEEGKGGFQKADADALAARKIRGLPKRSTAAAGPSSQPMSTDSSASGGPRFAGFTGFGTTPSNRDDVKTQPPSSFPSFISFGSTKTAATSTNPPDIRKYLFYLTTILYYHTITIASTSGLNKTPAAYQNAFTSASDAPKTPTHNPTLTKYFTDLRGLNNSFLQAIKDAVEKDPLVDLSGMAQSYRTHREAIQKERDSNEAKQTPQTATSTPSAPLSAVSAFTAFTPPSTKFTFGSSNPPAPQSTTGAPSTSSFSWPSSSTSSTDKASAPSFSFGASKTPSSGFFVFGESSTTEEASVFKAAAATTNAGEKQNAETQDKLSGSSTIPSFFKPQSAPITPGFSSFLPPSSLTAASNSQPSTSSTSFTFESSPSTANSFTAANNGNIGNPLGFSFGGSSKFPAFPSTTTASAASETTSSSSVLDGPAAKDEASTEGDESAAAENTQTENKENQYDKDGAGEEDEETQFETRSKAYINQTAADGKKSWSSVGTGQLKLKKQKEGTKRRLLMRNSSNGKIIINTLLAPNFKLTVEGKTISFIVPNADGTADLWKLRLSTEADAKQWEARVSEK